MLPFLYYSNGSAAEVVDQLQESVDVQVGDSKLARRAKREAERLRFMLTRLIASLERRLESEGR